MASLLLVSHSPKIVEGVRELALQMAGEAEIVAVGGAKDGGLGSDYDRILAALETLARKGEVVVLCDLGSALLTSQMAAEALDEDLQGRVCFSNAALVEGGLAAAVAIAAGQNAAATLAQLEEFVLDK